MDEVIEGIDFYCWNGGIGNPLPLEYEEQRFFSGAIRHTFDLLFYVKNEKAIEFFTKEDITKYVGIDFSRFYFTQGPQKLDPVSFAARARETCLHEDWYKSAFWAAKRKAELAIKEKKGKRVCRCHEGCI